MWLSLILTLSSQVFIPLWLQSKESAWNAGGKKDQVWSLDKEDPLEDEMATHSSILAWKIPWMEEPRMLHPWGCKELDMTERLSLLLTDPCHMTQKIWYNFIKNTPHTHPQMQFTQTLHCSACLLRIPEMIRWYVVYLLLSWLKMINFKGHTFMSDQVTRLI